MEDRLNREDPGAVVVNFLRVRSFRMSKAMFSKDTLETIVSVTEFWGVLITAIGAALLVVTVVANKPLKKMLAAEALQQQRESDHKTLELQKQIADAQKTAALANEQAEQERLARLRIEERLAPRRIGAKE